jgi:hypothetical protein
MTQLRAQEQELRAGKIETLSHQFEPAGSNRQEQQLESGVPEDGRRGRKRKGMERNTISLTGIFAWL